MDTRKTATTPPAKGHKAPVTATIGTAGTPSEFVAMIDRFMPPLPTEATGFKADEKSFTWRDSYGYTWTVTVSNGD